MTTTMRTERPVRSAAPKQASTQTSIWVAPKTRAVDAGAARARASAARAPVQTPRAPFVLLVVGLLGGALVSLLLLNTVLAKDAFTLTELQQSNKQLLQQRQALQEDIAREESSANLAQKAKALGMVEPGRPAFVDARTGQITGGAPRPVPHPPAAPTAASGAVVPGVVVPGAAVPGVGNSGRAAAQPKSPGGGR